MTESQTMNDAARSLPVGYPLHEYRIDAVLGVGGFGVTYLATDANLGFRVAVKEYFPGDYASRCEDGTVRPRSEEAVETFQWGLQRFVDEAKTLASFRHPNIVRVMRFFRTNQTAYMVMEFVEGMPLPEWIAPRRPFTEGALLGVVAPLIDGLEVVHNAGYLHRDIKPANIFMRDEGSPVLIDFGSARQVTPRNQNLTVIVSPGYAPLEQYHAEGRQGPWTDLYALGGVMYWMVTAHKPLDAAARVRQDAMLPARHAADLKAYSPALLSAIDWALKPNEAERPQNAAELRAALARSTPISPRGGVAMPLDASPVPAPPASREAATMPRPDPFDREVISRLEGCLAKHIGPIAPMVVSAAARKSLDMKTLCELVAKEIVGERERQDFINAFASGGSTIGAAGHPVAEPEPPVSRRFSADALQKTELQLAKHIGPIASVVVKRAAKIARDQTELYLIIADEIQDIHERKAFVRMAVSVHRRRR